MIQVRFVKDYRGVLTGEQFYEMGAVVSFEDTTARQLVNDGRAEIVKPSRKPRKTTRKKVGS